VDDKGIGRKIKLVPKENASVFLLAWRVIKNIYSFYKILGKHI